MFLTASPGITFYNETNGTLNCVGWWSLLEELYCTYNILIWQHASGRNRDITILTYNIVSRIFDISIL